MLAKEVLKLLIPHEDPCKIIDGTVGYGGHSSLILNTHRKAVLLGLDRDAEAIGHAEKILEFAGERVHLKKDNFSNLAECAAGIGWLSVDAVLLDLGISSPQIDSAERGFSLRLNGPLDMRMDCQARKTASHILNNASENELERIFREYGEIHRAGGLAAAILERRKSKPWETTLEFADFCNKHLGRQRRFGLQAATLCFQALRIEVNNELEELKKALESALKILSHGGRIAVISFHSIEDRIVKQFFHRESSDCVCPPEIPVCSCGHKKQLKVITKKPLTPSAEEIELNRRSSSAKLRVAEKL